MLPQSELKCGIHAVYIVCIFRSKMVYFTCDACGEQLKKPSVEKHYTQKCRDCYKLTCIDCLKDFYGEEYQAHTSCMSEDQRYSKEGRGGWDPSKGQVSDAETKEIGDGQQEVL